VQHPGGHQEAPPPIARPNSGRSAAGFAPAAWGGQRSAASGIRRNNVWFSNAGYREKSARRTNAP